VHRDEIDSYAFLWDRLSSMAGEDGMPQEAIARVIADAVERQQPPLRVASDSSIEQLLRSVDASDRFRQAFDLAALGS